MSTPGSVPELAGPRSAVINEAEINRCLESAAALVQGFTERGAVSALDVILAASGESAPVARDRVRLAAAAVLQQTATLHDEVGRFLSLTKK